MRTYGKARDERGEAVAIMRRPHHGLRPFVRLVWAADQPADPVARREQMLPSTCPHLVLRLDDEPLELFELDTDDPVRCAGAGTVAGSRSSPYIRSVPLKGRTLGVLLEPGATHAVLGLPGGELAGRHTALADVFGRGATAVRDRLADARTLEDALSSFEQVLLAKLRPHCGPHPAVMQALSRFTGCPPVHVVVRESGYSHRQFNQHFRRAVGMAPKLYSRVLRFEGAVARWGERPDISLCELALGCGYSDQSHLSREFREFAGISMTAYRAVTTPGSRHVPLQRDARGLSQPS